MLSILKNLIKKLKNEHYFIFKISVPNDRIVYGKGGQPIKNENLSKVLNEYSDK